MKNGSSKLRPPPAPPAVIREGGSNLSEPFPPTPSRRYSGRGSRSIRRRFCQPVGSQPLLATLTTFPVCLVTAFPIQEARGNSQFLPLPSASISAPVSCIAAAIHASSLPTHLLLPGKPPPRPILGHGHGRGTGGRSHPLFGSKSTSRPSENIS